MTLAVRDGMSPRNGQRELDEVTWARAKRGDERALEALVECYQRPIFALLSRMLRPRGLGPRVEDLAQECLLRVFRALPRFQLQPQTRPSTWILTIATRLAIDEMRRQGRGPDRFEPAVDLPAREHTAAAMERRVLLGRVADIVGELHPDQVAVLLLRVCHDRSYQEIAEILAIDVGTVKSRLSRARACLRETLVEVSDV